MWTIERMHISVCVRAATFPNQNVSAHRPEMLDNYSFVCGASVFQ